MSTEQKDDFPYGFAKGKVPILIQGIGRWDNFLQDDIFEIHIGPFKTEEAVIDYINKLKEKGFGNT